MISQKLERYLEKRIDQPTVILCFKILLQNIIQNGIGAGMSKSEIAKVFNAEHHNFGIQRFKTDYILRQTGMGDSAILEKNDVFFIDSVFLEGSGEEEWNEIISNINIKYSNLEQERQRFYEEIHSVKSYDVNERRGFILDMLLYRETEKKGQTFEVTAFAILKVYYSNRGFELNRFSTIYSNDGGIDYTSQSSIYQVTTLLSDAKFNEDIKKAPMKNRIFVYRKAAPNFNFDLLKHKLVIDYINTDDLLHHLDYMIMKSPVVNTNKVLDVILSEFEREFYKQEN